MLSDCSDQASEGKSPLLFPFLPTSVTSNPDESEGWLVKESSPQEVLPNPWPDEIGIFYSGDFSLSSQMLLVKGAGGIVHRKWHRCSLTLPRLTAPVL